MSYARITNVALVVEAIRRARRNSSVLNTGGYEGARYEAVVAALVPRLLSPQAITEAVKELLQSKEILLTGYIYESNPSDPFAATRRLFGPIHGLHPEVLVARDTLTFSLNGTPMRETWGRSGERAVRTYPIVGMNHFLCLRLQKCYVIEDGLPDSVKSLSQKPPLELPCLPAR